MPANPLATFRIPPREPSAFRWSRYLHERDRELPAPIIDRDPGDETWSVRIIGRYSDAFFEHWTCRVCFLSNGLREQLLKRTGGKRCGYCNSERPEHLVNSR